MLFPSRQDGTATVAYCLAVQVDVKIMENKQELIAAIKRDILNIGCIYRTVGQALYDEPVTRLAERIATTVERMEQCGSEGERERGDA